MSDALVLVLTGLLAVGVFGWTLGSIWRIARHTPTRQRALTYVLASVAGTALLGVILPAGLNGALDPLPIWLAYAVPTVGVAAVLGWRWPALARGDGRHPSLAITCCLVLAMAAVAVT